MHNNFSTSRIWGALTFPQTLAKAHWQTQCKAPWRYTHKAIAAVEYVPIIGHLVALVDLMIQKARCRACPSLASRGTLPPLMNAHVAEAAAGVFQTGASYHELAKQWMHTHPEHPEATEQEIAAVLKFCIEKHYCSREHMVAALQQGKELLNPTLPPGSAGDCWTPLMHAALRGNKEIVASLLKMGVNLETSNRYGQTALIVAATQNHIKVMDLLLDVGAHANIHAVDHKGRSALMHAVQNNHPSGVQYLLAAGARPTEEALRWAIYNEKKEIVAMLLGARVNPNAMNADADTMIVYAEKTVGKNSEILGLLMQHGADYQKGKEIEQWANAQRKKDKHWRLSADLDFDNIFTFIRVGRR